MPILVKDFSWEETDKHLFVKIPLKGVKSGKLDVLTTENYIKVRNLYYRPGVFDNTMFTSQLLCTNPAL